MSSKNDTTARKAEREFDAWWDLIKRRPILGIFIISIFLGSFGWNVYNYFNAIPTLNEKIENLTNANKDMKSDLQLCETKLAPFKAVAAEWYQGTEAEKLSELAQRIIEIDQQLKAQKDFQEVAKISIDGSLSLGGGIGTSTMVGGWAKNCATINNNSIEYNCSDKCYQQYIEKVGKAPWWPYPMFGIGECLKEKGVDHWEVSIKAGLALLNHIVLVPHHLREHEIMFNYYKAKYPTIKYGVVKFRDSE